MEPEQRVRRLPAPPARPPADVAASACAAAATRSETSSARPRRALRSDPARRNAATAAWIGTGVWKSAARLTRASRSMIGRGAAIQPIRIPGTRSFDSVPSQTARSRRRARERRDPRLRLLEAVLDDQGAGGERRLEQLLAPRVRRRDAGRVLPLGHQVDELDAPAVQRARIRARRATSAAAGPRPPASRASASAPEYVGDSTATEVARVGEGAKEKVQALLGAADHQDLVGGALDPALGQPARDLPAQFLQAERGSVLPEIAPAAPGVGDRPRELLEREEPLVRSEAREIGDSGGVIGIGALVGDAGRPSGDQLLDPKGLLRPVGGGADDDGSAADPARDQPVLGEAPVRRLDRAAIDAQGRGELARGRQPAVLRQCAAARSAARSPRRPASRAESRPRG